MGFFFSFNAHHRLRVHFVQLFFSHPFRAKTWQDIYSAIQWQKFPVLSNKTSDCCLSSRSLAAYLDIHCLHIETKQFLFTVMASALPLQPHLFRGRKVPTGPFFIISPMTSLKLNHTGNALHKCQGRKYLWERWKAPLGKKKTENQVFTVYCVFVV